jgi:hypothetical protein
MAGSIPAPFHFSNFEESEALEKRSVNKSTEKNRGCDTLKVAALLRTNDRPIQSKPVADGVTTSLIGHIERASKRGGEHVQLRKAYRSFAAYIGGKAKSFRRSIFFLQRFPACATLKAAVSQAWFRSSPSEEIANIEIRLQPYVVCRKGHEGIVLVPGNELAGLIETAHLLRSDFGQQCTRMPLKILFIVRDPAVTPS